MNAQLPIGMLVGQKSQHEILRAIEDQERRDGGDRLLRSIEARRMRRMRAMRRQSST